MPLNLSLEKNSTLNIFLYDLDVESDIMRHIFRIDSSEMEVAECRHQQLILRGYPLFRL